MLHPAQCGVQATQLICRRRCCCCCCWPISHAVCEQLGQGTTTWAPTRRSCSGSSDSSCSACALSALTHSSQVIINPRQLLSLNLAPDDLTGPRTLSLHSITPHRPSTASYQHHDWHFYAPADSCPILRPTLRDSMLGKLASLPAGASRTGRRCVVLAKLQVLLDNSGCAWLLQAYQGSPVQRTCCCCCCYSTAPAAVAACTRSTTYAVLTDALTPGFIPVHRHPEGLCH
jgi:hypothetical protein